MGPGQWEMPTAPPQDWPRAPIVAPPVPPHPPAPKRLGPAGWMVVALLVVVALVGAAVVLAAVVPERDEQAADEGADLGPATDDLTAPRVVGGCCLVALGLDEVVGLSPDAGEVGWRTPCPVPGWASVVDSPSADVAVVTCDGETRGIDGRSGQQLWSRPTLPSNRLRVGPAAVIVQSDDDGVTAIDIDTGADLFRLDGPMSANVASDAERVYTSDDAGVTARELATGDILWSVPQPSSGLVATDEAVFARTNQHEVLRLDPATGDTEGRSGEPVPELLSWSDFVATSPEVVVLRGTRPPYATVVYDATTLERLWEDEAAGNQPLVGGAGVVAVVDPSTGVMVVRDERTGDEVLRVDDVAGVNPAVLGDSVVYATSGFEGRLAVVPFR